jgi:hypothetical protein
MAVARSNPGFAQLVPLLLLCLKQKFQNFLKKVTFLFFQEFSKILFK